MDLNKYYKISFEEIQKFRNMKNLISRDYDSNIISKYENDFNFIADELIINYPDTDEIIQRLNELSSVLGIQSYINDYRKIII
jgi:sensor histidine kinase YesM